MYIVKYWSAFFSVALVKYSFYQHELLFPHEAEEVHQKAEREGTGFSAAAGAHLSDSNILNHLYGIIDDDPWNNNS